MRIQLGQGSAGEVTRNMLKAEGVGAFYKVRFKDLLEICDSDSLNCTVDLGVHCEILAWSKFTCWLRDLVILRTSERAGRVLLYSNQLLYLILLVLIVSGGSELLLERMEWFKLSVYFFASTHIPILFRKL